MRPSHKEGVETDLTPTMEDKAMTGVVTVQGCSMDMETGGSAGDMAICRGIITTAITAAIKAVITADMDGMEGLAETDMITAGTTEETMTDSTEEDTEAGN
jgi:hypothetical protein